MHTTRATTIDTPPHPTRRAAGWRREVGLDAARALALLGMCAAHTIAPHDGPGDVVHGRSAILFAIVAGFGIAMMAGGHRGPGSVSLPDVRLRIVVRAMALFVLGEILDAFGVPIVVILQVYAVTFVAAAAFVGVRVRTLLGAAVIAFAVGPMTVLLPWPMSGALLSGNFTTYPVVQWLGLVLVGMAVGRIDPARTRRLVVTLGAAAVGGAAAYACGWGLWGLLTSDAVRRCCSGPEAGRVLWSFVSPDPHSGSAFEMVGGAGISIALVLALLLSTRLPWIRQALVPLVAVGSIALSLYVLHAVLLGVAGWLGRTVSVADFWITIGIVAALAVGMRALHRRGPLEAGISWFVVTATRALRSGDASSTSDGGVR